MGIRGVCAGFQASRQRERVPMAIDPEELVTLKNHGTMKLRSAVARTMTLLPKERKRATIVRKGEPAVLKFEQIKDLAVFRRGVRERSASGSHHSNLKKSMAYGGHNDADGGHFSISIYRNGRRLHPSRHDPHHAQRFDQASRLITNPFFLDWLLD